MNRSNCGRTKVVAALLEVVEEGLAHADGAPFVLLVDERHGCGGCGQREAVEGSKESARAGKRPDASCSGGTAQESGLNRTRVAEKRARQGTRPVVRVAVTVTHTRSAAEQQHS